MAAFDAPIRSVAIIGAGIIGLSCARALAARGMRVTLFEKQWPPRGASWAAAGMLAPAFEAVGLNGSHPDLFQLCDHSARMWPAWAAELERDSGKPSGYQPGPSLAVALTQEQDQHLRDVALALADHDQPPSLHSSDLRDIDPSITKAALSGLLLPTDGQADNRATLEALLASVMAHPMIDIVDREAPLKWTGNGLDHAGHGATLITSGWQSGSVHVDDGGQLRSLQDLEPMLTEIGPVGGQMLSVAPIKGGPKLTLRSGHVYIVPKQDRIVIGATSEPGRILSESEPDQIEQLRAAAIEIAPILSEARVLESWAGVRPGQKNHAPMIGATRLENVFVASGHYRNGILLAPITAEMIADMIVDQNVSALAAAFAPETSAVERV